jgi:hypothetical protein
MVRVQVVGISKGSRTGSHAERCREVTLTMIKRNSLLYRALAHPDSNPLLFDSCFGEVLAKSRIQRA